MSAALIAKHFCSEERIAFPLKVFAQAYRGIALAVVFLNNKIVKVPLSDVAGKLKMVSPDDEIVKQAKLLGISFGDE